MELYALNIETWKAFDVHRITLRMINEHHTISIKHMVKRLQTTMDSISTECQADLGVTQKDVHCPLWSAFYIVLPSKATQVMGQLAFFFFLTYFMEWRLRLMK